MDSRNERGTWGTRTGFILAAAGSAVGLGNIWGFPTRVGQGGGAAFVFVYLVCVALICFPIMVSEIALGRRTAQSPVGSFAKLSPGTSWWLVGALGVLTGAGILSFYCIIAGWTVAYFWFTATGSLTGNQQEIGAFFVQFTTNVPLNIGLAFFVLAVTASVLLGGVRSGIERATKSLMPLLLILLVILACRALTLPGAAEGLAYYLKPSMSSLLDISVYQSALGQAFFSLSLGMGAMITYGSYLNRSSYIAGSAIWIVALDTTIALLAGLIIFPSGFSIPGFDPSSSGPGLIFTVLPRLFDSLPGGQLFGASFFLLLTTAALTSTISLLEVPVAHFVDSCGWSRIKAVLIVTLGVFALSIPSALGTNPASVFSNLPILGLDFLTLMATVWNDFALPIGGLLTALFVGWIWHVDQALEELEHNQAWFPASKLWGFLIRWVCPAAIVAIICGTLYSLL